MTAACAARLCRALAPLICALSLCGAPAPYAAEPYFDPASGYRVSHYRAPVPATVPGGTTITIDELQARARDGAILIDVMPSEGAGADPSTGVWHVPKARRNMAGSVWLPDVGKGELTLALEAYFKDNLAALSASDKTRPIVVYCQSDCWMSWNAVKRASGWGYTRLYWYPEGTDGMADWDVPLVPAIPVPMRPPSTATTSTGR